MQFPNLVRTSAFRITALYAALFAASTITLLSVIYGSTVGLIARQTDETIDAEVRGLAEQYRREGLSRLIAIVRERSGTAEGPNENVYLLTDAGLRSLAGNLVQWPENARRTDADGTGAWIRFEAVREEHGQVVAHEIRARIFILAGGFRLLVGRDRHEESRFRDTVATAMVWSLGAVIGLGLLGGGLLSRRVLERVEHVAESARRIGAGALAERIPETGSGDEFDRLAEGLNAMLERIDRLMTGMRLATDSLAHDLRSPLTRLKSRIEIALQRDPDGPRDREALTDVLAQADQVLGMFDNLLRIALAESGTAVTALRPLDLADVVVGVADLYEPVAEDVGLAFEVTVAKPAMIVGHHDLLAQALSNLVDNAIKYSPSGGQITLALTPGDDSVSLEICDTGPGIPSADQERVLEPFVRLEPSRSTPGSGLGLSLAAAVIRLHDGTMTLDDNNPGLCIRIAFPSAADEGVAIG